ncbi:MAG TPA: hypothetical protein VGC41_26395 [Kofleriaceae bacterium]
MQVQRGERFVTQLFYFPSRMYAEMDEVAGQLETDIGAVAWAAWEATKANLHETFPLDRDTAVATFSEAPPPYPGHNITLPERAPEITGLPVAGKMKAALRFPSQVLREIQNFATTRDRTVSWVMQKAYARTRSRLHAAARHVQITSPTHTTERHTAI